MQFTAKKLKPPPALFFAPKMSIPMYFAVSHDSDFGRSREQEFKLYHNTIYDRPDGFRQNVIWPIDHARGKCLTIRLANTNENDSIIRSWDGTEYDSLKWSFTGSSIKILLEAYGILVTAPVILISADYKELLPFNSHSFSPEDTKFIDEQERNTYTPAKKFRTDPNSPENTAPIPIVHVRQPRVSQMTIPTAPPYVPTAPPYVPTAPPYVPSAPPYVPSAPPYVPSAPPAPRISSSLPPHITKIVLADSIRKNEACPITSEDITETNATVTSCGHVFTTAAITHWLSLPSSKGLCPVCKQKC